MIKTWMALLLFAVSSHCGSAETREPWYRQVPGEQIVDVQYVRLTGHEVDPAKNIEKMRQLYDTCSTDYRAVGHRVAPLPPEGFPPFQYTIHKEVYHARGRTALYSQNTVTDVDYEADCALKTGHSYSLAIYDAGGRCQINLTRHTGAGVCLAGKPDKHLASTTRPVSGPRKPIDWERIPEPQRTQLKQKLANLGMDAQKPVGPIATGARKRIVGVDCAVSELRMGTQTFSFCATDAHSVPSPMPDFVPSDLARSLWGVVLETKDPLIKLQATEFIPDLKVPQSVFEIPRGTRYLGY